MSKKTCFYCILMVALVVASSYTAFTNNDWGDLKGGQQACKVNIIEPRDAAEPSDVLVLLPFALRWGIDKFTLTPSQQATSGIIGSNDCGPQSLRVICQLFGIQTSVEELATFAATDSTGTTINGLCRAAQQKGLNATIVKWAMKELKETALPVIVFVDGNHFLVVESVEEEQFRIWDASKPPMLISEHSLKQRWQGHTIVFHLTFA